MTGRDMGVALLVVLLWSMNLIVQKIAVGHLSIFVLSFLRVILVFPLLFLYPKPQKSLWKYFLCGFFLAALYLSLFGYGLQTNIGAGLSSFFLQAQVFFGILCCFLILGEKPTWFQMLGIFIAFLGVYFLKAFSPPSDLPIWGIILLLGSCLSFGIGIAISKKYTIGTTMADVTWLYMTAAFPLLLACLIFEGPLQTFEEIVYMSWTALFCVLFGTVFSTIWATYLWLGLLQRAQAAAVTPFMLLLPILSNIIASITLEETLTSLQMASGCIIIVGVMFSQGIHQWIPSRVYWIKDRDA